MTPWKASSTASHPAAQRAQLLKLLGGCGAPLVREGNLAEGETRRLLSPLLLRHRRESTHGFDQSVELGGLRASITSFDIKTHRPRVVRNELTPRAAVFAAVALVSSKRLAHGDDPGNSGGAVHVRLRLVVADAARLVCTPATPTHGPDAFVVLEVEGVHAEVFAQRNDHG
jgi:hypothetical protein